MLAGTSSTLPSTALHANARMLIQLLAIGYVLTYVFETEEAFLIVLVVLVMIGVSAWIAIRPLREHGRNVYSVALVSIAASGTTIAVRYQIMAMCMVFGSGGSAPPPTSR